MERECSGGRSWRTGTLRGLIRVGSSSLRAHRAWGMAALALLGSAAMVLGGACSGAVSSLRWRMSAEGRATHAYTAAGTAESAHDYDEAIRLYEKALALVPQSPTVLYRCAVTQAKAGRPEKFWKALEHAVEVGYAYSWEIEDEPVLKEL